MRPAYLLGDDDKSAYRICVEREDDNFPTSGLITISEEALTSRSEKAQVTSVHGAVDLDDNQALFVHRELTAYLQSRGKL